MVLFYSVLILSQFTFLNHQFSFLKQIAIKKLYTILQNNNKFFSTCTCTFLSLTLIFLLHQSCEDWVGRKNLCKKFSVNQWKINQKKCNIINILKLSVERVEYSCLFVWKVCNSREKLKKVEKSSKSQTCTVESRSFFSTKNLELRKIDFQLSQLLVHSKSWKYINIIHKDIGRKLSTWLRLYRFVSKSICR